MRKVRPPRLSLRQRRQRHAAVGEASLLSGLGALMCFGAALGLATQPGPDALAVLWTLAAFGALCVLGAWLRLWEGFRP